MLGMLGCIPKRKWLRSPPAFTNSGSTIPSWWGPAGGIIAGHARVLAARMLGYTEIPVIVLGPVSENQKLSQPMARRMEPWPPDSNWYRTQGTQDAVRRTAAQIAARICKCRFERQV